MKKVVAVVAFFVLFAALGVTAGAAPRVHGTPRPPESIVVLERRVANILLESYKDTDFSFAYGYVSENPEADGNPNVFVIPLSMGYAHALRHERSQDIADLVLAADYLEFALDRYGEWGKRWLSPGVMSYAGILLRIIEAEAGCGVDQEYATRLAALRVRMEEVAATEADFWLSKSLPPEPYDSATTGDTKAEEYAWLAALFSYAANEIPWHPNAVFWEARARQLAYDAITRPSDAPDGFGVKTTTVTEDLALSNHGVFPNPWYAASVIMLLRQASLPYGLHGKKIPVEFFHNVQGLYSVYSSYIEWSDDGVSSWDTFSDPTGDPSLFPLAGYDTPETERAYALYRIRAGYLWKEVGSPNMVGPGDDLWAAIQNAKVVWYYVMGSYLWHMPSASCE